MNFALVKKENIFGGTLLVSGCCIGAGMVGLPVVSAATGFIPSSIVMIACYLFATVTGLLILEATLWFNRPVNLLSLAEFSLGKIGKAVTAFLFLFLLYCLLVAYLDGGGQLMANMLESTFHGSVSREIGIVAFAAVFGSLLLTGTLLIEKFNRLLMFGLIAFYLAMVSYGLPEVKVDRLMHMDFEKSLATVPILLICFGFQNLVPTLTNYLKRDVDAIRFAIVIGNLIPFVIYFLWNFVILGILPDGNGAMFDQTGTANQLVSELLAHSSKSGYVIASINGFCFMAIITSFLPNALSFMDFLKDAFKPIHLHVQIEKYIIFGIVTLPPTVFTLFFPHLFLKALTLAGGLIDVLLLGVIPVLIIYVGRYVKKTTGPYKVSGGKPLLACIFIFSIIVLVLGRIF